MLKEVITCILKTS